MKVVFYGYRDWSINIFSNLAVEEKYLVTGKDYSLLDHIKPDLVFFIGWSNIVPNEVVEKYTCVCLHPSSLPSYRGGSPIQNQIIDGVIDSAVTFFIMDQGLDSGDILYQDYLSLEGSLATIFKRIEESGILYLNKIIDDFGKNSMIRHKQDESKASLCKRRKASQSEITFDEILNNEPEYLYNKVRCLNDPYPNAYIKCKDGKKLYLIETRHEK